MQDSRRTARSIWSRGIVVSCNAYFAQLGTYDVGAEPLLETANLLGIAAASPDTAAELKKSLPQSAYGQGQVVASPFQMARVAATVANDGTMPQGRWIDRRKQRARQRRPSLYSAPDAASTLGSYMREVVTDGTGRRGAATRRRWRARPARRNWRMRRRTPGSSASRPTERAARKIAFSVLVENGVYGGDCGGAGRSRDRQRCSQN